MMPSLAEITFSCTLCDGPLIAWQSDAGQATDCPHCLKPITIPGGQDVEVVNKDTFCEPRGLRRILQEVRDSEWEAIRRKLQETKARVKALENELQTLRAEKAIGSEAGLGSGETDPLAALRQQLAETTARSAAVTEKFAASKQQHEVALDRLQDSLEHIRAEVGPLREENADMLRELNAARAELVAERQESSVAKEELARVKARTAGRRSMPMSSSLTARVA